MRLIDVPGTDRHHAGDKRIEYTPTQIRLRAGPAMVTFDTIPAITIKT